MAKKRLKKKPASKTKDRELWFLQAILDSVPLAIFCKDYESKIGKFVGWNATAEKLWGLKFAEVLGKSDFDFFPEDQAKFFQEKDLLTIEKMQQVFIEEEPVESPIVGHRTVRTWKVPVKDINGKPRYLLGISQDMTERKDLESQLEQQRMVAINAAKLASLGEMAGGLAHEINNPLAIIKSYNDRLARLNSEDSITTEEIEKITQKIESTVKRITSIVDGLRNFSREGSNDPIVEESLSEVIDETVSFCRERFNHFGVNLVFDVATDIQCECRKVQLAQVLINLLNNALDAASISQEKWVRISAEDVGGAVQILVSDSGGGVPKDNQDKIFQPFFTTKDVGKGTGLGLSICKGLVESIGGALELSPDKSHTTFIISLPKKQKNRSAA